MSKYNVVTEHAKTRIWEGEVEKLPFSHSKFIDYSQTINSGEGEDARNSAAKAIINQIMTYLPISKTSIGILKDSIIYVYLRISALDSYEGHFSLRLDCKSI
ncbi:hypothetical protein DASC09_040380 [Saccharomycopsis crataegensis]|uniref:Uncharacterized protein n=1 Tax=Saccharomycopsis crataegensis TaxID=43959 RepID=A0AAV5QPK6_9ASCO|nr:hypothetical protein DASC09_040380 [Saccharomycopsis crataegensis]